MADISTVQQLPAPFIEAAGKTYLSDLQTAIGGLRSADLSKVMGPQFVAPTSAITQEAQALRGGLGSFAPFLHTAAKQDGGRRPSPHPARRLRGAGPLRRGSLRREPGATREHRRDGRRRAFLALGALQHLLRQPGPGRLQSGAGGPGWGLRLRTHSGGVALREHRGGVGPRAGDAVYLPSC